MKTIHIVMGGSDYESSSAIKAFTSKAAAAAFAEKCNTYKETRPELSEDTNLTLECYEKHNAAEDRWRTAHPAGIEHSGEDWYSVTVLPVESET